MNKKIPIDCILKPWLLQMAQFSMVKNEIGDIYGPMDNRKWDKDSITP